MARSEDDDAHKRANKILKNKLKKCKEDLAKMNEDMQNQEEAIEDALKMQELDAKKRSTISKHLFIINLTKKKRR